MLSKQFKLQVTILNTKEYSAEELNLYHFLHIMEGFGLVGFYGISTIVGYLMPNLVYTLILDIYVLVWVGFMTHQPL